MDSTNAGLFVRERGAGATVLMIHGTGCDSDFWGDVTDQLAERCRVITYDRRGYGRSAARPPGSLDEQTDDAAEIIRAHGGEVCGSSRTPGGMC